MKLLRKNTKVITAVLSLTLMASILAIGCAPQQKPPPERYDMDTRDEIGTRYDDRYTGRLPLYGPNTPRYDRFYGFYGRNGMDTRDYTYDNIPMGMNRYRNGMDVALTNRIENEVEKIDKIKDATIIKNEDTCYVGVDTTGDIKNVAALRTNIANRVRRIDPDIDRVYVTTDEDRVTKLRNYARDIDLGRPVREFLDDLNDLFR